MWIGGGGGGNVLPPNCVPLASIESLLSDEAKSTPRSLHDSYEETDLNHHTADEQNVFGRSASPSGLESSGGITASKSSSYSPISARYNVYVKQDH